MEFSVFHRRFAATIALLAALTVACPLLSAKEYSFKLYSREEGLLNQVINCLLQDRNGFLWAGTENGLYRYDGSRFLSFGRPEGLPDETILSLFEDTRGTLWVGTRLGIATFDGKRRFVPDAVLGKVEIFGYSNIVSDAQGRMYVGTARGLAVGEKATSTEGIRFHFVTKQAVHGVYVDRSNVLWYGAEGKLWFSAAGTPVAVGPESQIPIDRWDSMLSDRNGTLWVRSSERLVFRRKGSQTFESVAEVPHSPEFGSIYEMPDGRVFVPTDGGLMAYDGGRWERIGSRQGLVSDETTCLLHDREGSVWVGMGGEGLERWLGFDEWESWTVADGLSSNIIWDIKRDSLGQLWIATESGLHVQDRTTNFWKLESALGVSVRTFLEDVPHKAIWYGTNPGGVFRLDLKTGHVRRFGIPAGLTSDRVDKLFWGQNAELWVATRAGLFHGTVISDDVHFKREELPYTDANEGFFGNLLDREGRLWVGGSRGLVVLEGGKWRRFSRSDGLLGDGVSQLAQTPDGAIWLGYLDNSGVSRLDYRQGKVHFDHFTTSNGLTSNSAVSMNTDTRGWVWVGTDNGVDVYSNSTWRHYGKADGLVGDDCDSLAFQADPDGSVWIGTSSGASHFRPPLHAMNAPPRVYVTSLTAGSQLIDPIHPGSISYQDRSLLFNFAAPIFINEAAVRFRYRLVGLEQNWASAEERRVRYPNLTAGDYDFEVMAQNARGEWSPKAATVHFRILAPWWQTWTFRTLMGIVLIILTRRLWRFRIRYLIKKQQVLEVLLSQAQTATRLQSEALAKVTRGEAREKSRSQVLELIGSHRPLRQVLDSIIDMVESDDPETLCLILTLSDRKFHYGASRKLPVGFASLFEGWAVDSLLTCFAAAARRSEAVSVDDPSENPLWTHHIGHLHDLEVVCSRSAPIYSSSGEVLATITYFGKKPFSAHENSLGPQNAARLAGVAIEHLRLYEQLSHRAQYDVLTDLPNRVLFYDRLRQAIARAERHKTKLWVLWLDLDGFKHVNDTLGHHTGDLLLKEVARRISGCLRREDTAARIGGDEFTMVLESPEGRDVEAVIRKIVDAIGAPVTLGDREVCVTASVGVSTYPDDSRDAGELVRNADIAMYHVKRVGKNAHTFFVHGMADVEGGRAEIETHLRNALANREFELHYQPQFRLDRSLAGFEALLRWTNPKLGSVSPARFIPVAEAAGLIVPIGQWVLEEACRQTAEWNALGFSDFRMAVNVSAFQFARPDFAVTVAHLLRIMGIAPHQLELELTETAIMQDVVKSSAQLLRLRESGVTVSIDDFGTGYSSLSYLQRLPVDSIKIDQSFIRDLSSSRSSSLTMIQAIVDLAHDLRLVVVAEGVETEEQLAHVRSAGCDLAQGFLFHRPLNERAAALLLEERRKHLSANSEQILMENLIGASS